MDEDGKPIKSKVPLHSCESHFCPLRGLTRQWSYSTSSMDLLGIEHLLPKEEKEVSGWLWMRGKLTGRWKRRYFDLRNYTLRYAHSPEIFGNTIDHTKDEIITIAAHPAEPWGEGEGNGPGMPSFATTTITSPPSTSGELTPAPDTTVPKTKLGAGVEGGAVVSIVEEKMKVVGDGDADGEPMEAAEKTPAAASRNGIGINGGMNGAAKQNGDAYDKKKEMRELLRRLSLTERAEPLKPSQQDWDSRSPPPNGQQQQLANGTGNGYQSFKGGFSHHIWKLSQKGKPTITEIPIDRCRIDQLPHCPQPLYFWALQPYGYKRVYFFKADSWREQQRWVSAICLARMDAARRRFPEFDKWRQVNLTLDVPYKPCKATKKHITSYRHGDHIAIIPSAPAPSFAYGMKNLGNLRLLAGLSLGRLPFLSPLLTSSDEDRKTDEPDFEPQFDPDRVNVRSARTRLRMSEMEDDDEEDDDDLDETLDMETEEDGVERQGDGNANGVNGKNPTKISIDEAGDGDSIVEITSTPT